MDRLRDIRNIASACEVANEGEKEVALRRASGFHALYEAAVIKEIDHEIPQTSEPNSDPDVGTQAIPFQSTKGKQKQSDMDVESDAEYRPTTSKSPKTKNQYSEAYKSPVNHLKRQMRELLRVLVDRSAQKWTWGPQLTNDDVRDLANRYSLDFIRSGYAMSLSTGSLIDTVSDYAEQINEDPDDPRFDPLSPDIWTVRSLRPDEFPIAFLDPTLHHTGNPYGSLFDSSHDVVEAFSKGARAKGKRTLQEEVDLQEVVDESQAMNCLKSFSQVLAEVYEVEVRRAKNVLYRILNFYCRNSPG